MDRPQQSRGVATAPGVQRKAPRPVIQRENKPKGPRLEEQQDSSQRPTPVAGRGAPRDSLKHLGDRVLWESTGERHANHQAHFQARHDDRKRNVRSDWQSRRKRPSSSGSGAIHPPSRACRTSRAHQVINRPGGQIDERVCKALRV